MFQAGTALNVPADGSGTVSVTYPFAFANVAYPVATIAEGASDSGSAIAVQIFAESLSGFSLYCTGGTPSSTCSVNWNVQGA